MAKFNNRINYRDKFPDLSDEIINELQKSDRKMEYQQYDLKVNRYKIDCDKKTVTYIPSREDSYDRLLDEDKQFYAETESVEDIAVNTLMIERMMTCIKALSMEEQSLIYELFFQGKSEHQLSRETGIPRMTLHDRKIKILEKLRNLLEK